MPCQAQWSISNAHDQILLKPLDERALRLRHDLQRQTELGLLDRGGAIVSLVPVRLY